MGQGIPTTEELRALGLDGAVDTLQAQNATLRAEVERLRGEVAVVVASMDEMVAESTSFWDVTLGGEAMLRAATNHVRLWANKARAVLKPEGGREGSSHEC